jgi:hypothetical protein
MWNSVSVAVTIVPAELAELLAAVDGAAADDPDGLLEEPHPASRTTPPTATSRGDRASTAERESMSEVLSGAGADAAACPTARPAGRAGSWLPQIHGSRSFTAAQIYGCLNHAGVRHVLSGMGLPTNSARTRVGQGLGVLWLIDGLLQLQPFMWTRKFGSGTLASAAEGQPVVVAAPVRLWARWVAAHPFGFNLVFVAAQLAIGVGLLLARSPSRRRLFCAASLAWALGVWALGEGLGGLLGGSATLAVGAPGAALLYAIVSVAAWPSTRPPDAWLPRAWAAVWVTGAVLQLLPGQVTGTGLGAQVEMASMMSPGVLARPELHLALWLAALPVTAAALLAGGLAAGFAWIGLAALGPRRRRSALLVGSGAMAVFWVIAQGFGGLSTAAATDPGSAPVLVLLAVAVAAVPLTSPHAAPASVPPSAPAARVPSGVPEQVRAVV